MGSMKLSPEAPKRLAPPWSDYKSAMMRMTENTTVTTTISGFSEYWEPGFYMGLADSFKPYDSLTDVHFRKLEKVSRLIKIPR